MLMLSPQIDFLQMIATMRPGFLLHMLPPSAPLTPLSVPPLVSLGVSLPGGEVAGATGARSKLAQEDFGAANWLREINGEAVLLERDGTGISRHALNLRELRETNAIRFRCKASAKQGGSIDMASIVIERETR